MYSLVVPKCENWIVVSLVRSTFHFTSFSWPWTMWLISLMASSCCTTMPIPTWPTEYRTQWMLKHQAYSLDLWPCNFHTFELPKNVLKHTSHDDVREPVVWLIRQDDVRESVVWLIRQQPKEFFADRMKWLVHQCGDISKLLQHAHLWTSSNSFHFHSHFKDILEQKQQYSWLKNERRFGVLCTCLLKTPF